MKSTQPGKDARTTQRDDTTTDKSKERSSVGQTGGAPAAEEDIGTEGAGTEPRQSADVQPESGSSPKRDRKDRTP